MLQQRIVNIEQREHRWWVYTYVSGAKKYFGPYRTKAEAELSREDVKKRVGALPPVQRTP